jgi:transcriptional regulator with XRE-family HTH domain
MSLVADARARTGLSQAAFAERVGTSRTRMSAYENGRTFPELDTLERIADAADAELALAPRGSDRVRKQFEQIASAVNDGDRSWALRLVAELVDWVRTGVVAVSCLQRDPGSTGSRHWDALVGGVVEMLATAAGMAVPAWASGPGRVLDEVWFYTTLASLKPHVFVTTPAALAARGVYLSADSLVSV